MIQGHPTRNMAWFGKLPCVGDFCSHNLGAQLLGEMDDWLSTAMKRGVNAHGAAWTQAYFENPMHGFVWGRNTLPALQDGVVIGVIMPSVDKAGRAFPFVLLEQIDWGVGIELSCTALENWFSHAHTVCADALNHEWSLEKLKDLLTGFPDVSDRHVHGKTLPVQCEYTDWFRIDHARQIKRLMKHHGLPHGEAFDVLMGFTVPSASQS